MGVIEHWRVYVCPDCGQAGTHATGCTFLPGLPVEHGNWVEVVPASQLRGAVDLDAATERVEALMIRRYGAGRSDVTREQARELARAALGGR